MEQFRAETSHFVALTLLAGSLFVCGVLLPVTFLGGGDPVPGVAFLRLAIALGAALAMALILILIRRGRADLANPLMVSIAYTGLLAGAWLGGGLHSPGLPGFVIVVVLAGVLFGRTAAPWWALLCLATVAAIGLFPPQTESETLRPDHMLRHLGALVVIVGIAGAILIRWSSRLRAALTAEWEQLQALEQRDRERQASEARFLGIAEQTRDLISELDPDGRFVYASPNHREVMGYPPEELLGRRFSDFVHPADLEGSVKTVNGQVELPLLRVRTADGSWRWVEVSGGLYTTAHGARHLLSISRDVTERVDAARRQRLRDAAASQAQKMEALGRLAGGITHDFNNLMTVIALNVEFLSDQTGADPLASRLLGQIRESATQATALTRKLLSFARPTWTEASVVDLNDPVEDVAQLLGTLVGEHIRLELQLEPSAGCVEADPSEIGQVVMNLVLNAKQAMPQGGEILLETYRSDLDEPKPCAAGTLAPGPYVALRVTDSGTGIDPGIIDQVFEPFFTTKAESGGTGLGLASVYASVRGAGGDLLVSNQPGEGTRVEILLPRQPDVIANQASDQPSTSVAGGDETVLLVEDQSGVLRATSRVLRSYGYQVLEASSGEQALELERSLDGPLHLLVTDAVMPGLHGPELAREVVSRRPGVGVLYFTGYSGESFDVGPDHPLLFKPVPGPVLAAKVREVLDQASCTSSAAI